MMLVTRTVKKTMLPALLVLLASGARSQEPGRPKEPLFEFPGTGVSGRGSAVLLAIDDVMLPLRHAVCDYLSKPAVHKGPVLTPTRDNPRAPDHYGSHFYGSVLNENGKFRMWYYPVSQGDTPTDLAQGPVCYAESPDGLRWTKPNLGQLEFRGSRANNAIRLPESKIEGVEVIRDDDDPDPARRYKMVYNPHNGKTWTIQTATSPDGIAWTPRKDFAMNWFVEQASFIRHGGLYIVHGQALSYSEGGARGGRQGYAWVSADFQRWLPASVPAFLLPEPASPADRGGSKPYDQVHLGVGTASFGTVAVGLYGLWHQRGWGEGGTSCDLGLVVSNDGLHFREPVKGRVYISTTDSPVTPLPGKNFPTILCQANGILNVGDETRIYHGRWRNAEYGSEYYAEVALATLPRDRWGALGLVPGAAEGSVWSAPVKVPAGGCRVSLNAEGASGIRVELTDEQFRPLDGFAGAASGTLAANGLDAPVVWSRGKLAALGGRTVRLHVELRKSGAADPRLYAVYLRK
jgi:hypothetical protein